jgi:hypothetical protein
VCWYRVCLSDDLEVLELSEPLRIVGSYRVPEGTYLVGNFGDIEEDFAVAEPGVVNPDTGWSKCRNCRKDIVQSPITVAGGRWVHDVGRVSRCLP